MVKGLKENWFLLFSWALLNLHVDIASAVTVILKALLLVKLEDCIWKNPSYLPKIVVFFFVRTWKTISTRRYFICFLYNRIKIEKVKLHARKKNENIKNYVCDTRVCLSICVKVQLLREIYSHARGGPGWRCHSSILGKRRKERKRGSVPFLKLFDSIL